MRATSTFIPAALAVLVLHAHAWSMGPHPEKGKPKTAPPPDHHLQKTSKQYLRHQQTSNHTNLAHDTNRQIWCPPQSQCTFLDTFATRRIDRWTAAHGYANGNPFANWWSKYKVFFDTSNKKVKLGIGNVAGYGKPYVSGQIQTTKWHAYGCYEVRMKPVRQAGVISTFFAYTGFWDAPEGFEKGHNEVDIEFVWRSAAGRMLMQCNYFTNGRGGHEKYINLGFDPERDLHNYGFKWTRDRIEWYVDGRKVHTAWSDIPKAERSRYKIMMNTWPVQNVAAGWAGFFSWQGYKSAVYDGVRFQRGDSCTIKNWFPA